MDLVVVARDMTSLRAPVHGGVVVVLGPQAGEDASLSPEMAIANAGWPLKLPWVDLCLLDVLGGLASPGDEFLASNTM